MQKYENLMQCPYCKSDLVYNSIFKYWICPNENCKSKDMSWKDGCGVTRKDLNNSKNYSENKKMEN